MNMKIDIIYEDNHILAVIKPQGIAVMKDSSGDVDFQTEIKNFLKNKYSKTGNVFLGIVHRLDRPVGGIMVFAKTSKAASRLSDQIRKNLWKKQYVAVVDGVPSLEQDTLQDFLLKDSKTNIVSVVKSDVPGAKKAILKYEVIDKNKEKALLKINLLTGRSHQIRVQLSSRGCPIVNDHKYNKKFNKNCDIALWATEVELLHPVTGKQLSFSAEVPVTFRDLLK